MHIDFVVVVQSLDELFHSGAKNGECYVYVAQLKKNHGPALEFFDEWHSATGSDGRDDQEHCHHSVEHCDRNILLALNSDPHTLGSSLVLVASHCTGMKESGQS